MEVLNIIIFTFEVIGTIAFAISGAMTAIEHKLDLFGIFLLAGVTATGGGVIRDLILGSTPPAAFEKPIYALITVSTVTGFLLFMKLSRKRFSFMHLINLFDTLGLAIFCIVGIDTAITAGFGGNMFLSVFVGVCTGIGGGIIRDILAGITPEVLYKKLYAIPAILGSCVYFIVRAKGPYVVALSIGVAFIVVFRYLAIYKRMSLPKIEIPKGE